MDGASDLMRQFRYLEQVLGIFADADAHFALLWKQVDGNIQFHVQCDDVFRWPTIDSEPILHTDMRLLQTCLDDLRKAGDQTRLLSALFAARKRRMRPRRNWLNHCDDSAKELFLACGPEREVYSEVWVTVR